MLARLGLRSARGLRVAAAQAQCKSTTYVATERPEDAPTGATPPMQLHLVTSAFCAAGRPQGSDRQYCTSPSKLATTGAIQAPPADRELHVRLARLWGMPCELLFEQQQLLAKMMGSAGCGTPVQALWLLVRAPQLRHASEASLRTSLRQLHRLVSHTDIERPAVLSAVYKFPWIMEGELPQQQQHQHSATAAPAQPAPAAQGAASGVAPATWSQELAAVVLELQQADYAEWVAAGAQGSRGLRMSPGFASAAVRTYLAVGEAKQALCAAGSAVANRLLEALPGPNYPPAAADAYTCKQHPSSDGYTSQHHPRASSSNAGAGADAVSASSQATAPGVPSAQQHAPIAAAARQQAATFSTCVPAASSGVAEVLHQLQEQQQQHLLLQQLLAACPHLTVLPPELLLARYHRLESVVEGSAESAQRLVAANRFLLMSYADQPAAAAAAAVPAGAGSQQGLRPSYA